MGKLFFWLLVAVVVFGGYRLMQIMERRSAVAASRREAKALAGEEVVACAHCGVYVPVSDAVHDKRHAYCSEQHRELGPIRDKSS